MKTKRGWLILAGIVVVAGLFVTLGLNRSTQAQHFAAKVERGEIRDVVEATGTINSVITVQVGSQVSGPIAKLNADFNSRVHKGDVIALIDPQLFAGALRQADADLENARANVTAAEANLAKAGAALLQTRAEYHRAKAQVSQTAAAVSVARANLDYTVIRSPIDGVIVARNVDVGQTVAASLQAPTIFTIAQDLTKMQVYAKVDESDVGRIRVRQPVTFKVDAFPKDLFRGFVSQVRMNPTTVQNVVTYDAIIDFANPELKLFPGMTAYVTIPVATAEDVVKIPNAALRYKPPLDVEAVRALYRKYGLAEAAQAAEPAGGGGGGREMAAGGRLAAAAPAGPGGRRPARGDSAVVWKLRADGTLEPVKVGLGITDHTYTEVTRLIVGAVKPGDDLVTSTVTSKTLPPGAPGIPRGPRRRR